MPKVLTKIPTIEPNTLYTLSQAAIILGVRPRTINGWRKDGKLNCSILGYRTIRVTGEELLNFANNHKEQATE